MTVSKARASRSIGFFVKGVVLFGLVGVLGGHALGDELEARAAASRAAAKEFGAQLKEALQSAMQQGGPVNAIEVCNETAPEIAALISAETGWRVARTALKTRNPDNAPDPWEQAMLQRFEQAKAQGEDVKMMEAFEVLGEGQNQQFRYMKAIATGPICLTCHGETLAPELRARLEALYPQDQATGFKLGDIRGAFTIQQPMNTRSQ